MFSSTSDPFSYSPYNNNNNNHSTNPPPPHNIIAGGGATDPLQQQLSCCSSPSLLMMFDHDHHHQFMLNPAGHSDTTTSSSFLCPPYPSNNNNNNNNNSNPVTNSPFLLPTDHPYYPNCHHLVDGIPAANYNNALTMQQQQQKKKSISNSSSGNKNKERHSKIETAGGVRDRRVRLSIATSRKFFDLQDMLGFDKPSKTLDWLLSNSAAAIQRLHITSHSLYNNTNTIPRLPAATEEVEETSVSRRAKARARARDRTSSSTSRSKQLTPQTTKPTLPLPSPHQYYHYNNNNTSTSTCNNFGVLYQHQQQPYLSGIAIGVGSSYSTEMIHTAASTSTRSTTATNTANDDGHSSLRLMKCELLKPPPQSTIKHQTPHDAHHKTTTATWDRLTDNAPTTGMQMSWEGDLNSSVAHFSNPPARFH